MTTKHIIQLSCVIVLTMALTACGKNFLDVKPKGKIIASAVKDYNNLLEDVQFNRLTGAGGLLYAQHILGDDVAALEPQYSAADKFGVPGTRPHHLFEWKDEMYRADDNNIEVAGLYERLYSINKIINEVMEATGGTLQQKEQYRAEAKCQRAFACFLLANYFARPYMEATAATDPAVPITLTVEFGKADFTRSSVKEVYDLMVKDLIEAIPHLPMMQTTANRFTKSAGEALLGKIYLFMGKADLALPLLEDAVADLPATFGVSGIVSMINFNTASVSPAPIGYVFLSPGLIATPLQGHGYPESLNVQGVAATWVGGDAGLILDPATYALFGPNDRRRLLYSNTFRPPAPATGPNLPAGLYRIRAGFIGNSIGIQLPDLYLLRAEARARTGDVPGAKNDLLTVRNNRMPAVDAAAGIPTEKGPMIRFIIEERRREFAGMGFRWFDMRRLSVDPLFADQQQFSHTVYNLDGTVKSTITMKPERLTLRFGQKIVSQTIGFVDNP